MEGVFKAWTEWVAVAVEAAAVLVIALAPAAAAAGVGAARRLGRAGSSTRG